LFGSAIPNVESKFVYSHKWGGMAPGDNFIDILQMFAEGKGVKDVLDYVENLEDGYKGIPMNLVMAD